MSRATIVLNSHADRLKAARWLADAPHGTFVEFKPDARTIDQNARLWVLLTKVAEQKTWNGVKLSTSDWKVLFTAAVRRELRMVPNLAGDGFVLLGESTSRMTKAEHGELQDFIEAWGAENGVTFSEPGQDLERGEAA